MVYQYTDATLERDGGVGILTLNRPEKLNAFTPKMEDDIRAALEELRNDDSVRCVVITGAGRAFSSGADVNAWDARIQEGGTPTHWTAGDGTRRATPCLSASMSCPSR